ncbi:MAG: DNA-directed RNA polymerase subunit A' [Candidatus Micrarchaeota archaeon]|nr:DNA-directed RNA polymerase subunit A' [Candidatus Micrarchaeota archaeon]
MVSSASKIIDRIKFGIFSSEQIRKLSAAKITIPDTYDDDGYPIDGGLVDVRLGVIDPGLKCKTCGGNIRNCPGHFGHIELVRPVIHPGYAKFILYLLRSACQKCGRLNVTIQESDFYYEVEQKEKELELSNDNEKVESGYNKEEDNESSVENRDKKHKIKSKNYRCTFCGAERYNVKLIKPTTFILLRGKEEVNLLPNEIKEWLKKIPNDDLAKIGFDPEVARPEWMILEAILVPPINVRPSITLETGERSEDDLTHKLVDIMRINQRLESNINAGAPQLIIEDLWELLQYHVTTYFDNESPNIPPARHRSGRPLKTIAQRLRGKEGRFRYNLSGKRVNFSARTVISPDPNISIDEVGVPLEIAEELTIPIRVTNWNMQECKKYILSDTYPRATYIIKQDGRKVKVLPTNKEQLANSLELGLIVERQIIDGDIALFNRQPSLHRISIMCHHIKVLPGKTLRLNPAVCPPYNADFDGDEMNLHIIQDEEARVEADLLLKVHRQILTPRYSSPLIKPNEDHVSAIHFLTRDNVELSKNDVSDLLYRVGIEHLPEPDLPNQMYSGRAVFSVLLPSSINVKATNKFGEEVVIEKGILKKGSLDNNIYSNEILSQIIANEGYEYARWFIDSSTRLGLELLIKYGMSVSLKDYQLTEQQLLEIEKIKKDGLDQINNLVEQFKSKTLKRGFGLTAKTTLEEKVMEITSQVRNSISKYLHKILSKDNRALIMAKIGARGSMLNVIQMSSLIGQQAVRGKRIKRGYRKRVLIHFKQDNYGGEAHGFVLSSFKKGQSPVEYWFHSIGGRESLVNTAIRTARSGYMQRRLINALQDLVVRSDLSVRDARDRIIQFKYGATGHDYGRPLPLEFMEKIVE